jgi:hypothetical protein
MSGCARASSDGGTESGAHIQVVPSGDLTLKFEGEPI